ncbi:MAG: endonuclease [Pseudomonadota bacterium]
MFIAPLRYVAPCRPAFFMPWQAVRGIVSFKGAVVCYETETTRYDRRRMLKTLFLVIVTLVALAALTALVQHLRLSTSADLPPQPDGTVRVASWNVHYIILGQKEGRWGLSGWEERKGPMDAGFKALQADIVAFQEMESFARGSSNDVNLARDWLLENNPAYTVAATGPAATFPNTQPMLYRPDRFEVLDQGWFFFSTTPDAIYSRTFNGSFPAFASWAEFRETATDAVFRIVNIHTDAFSHSNRVQSIELVAERVSPWIAAGQTVLVVGDLNGLNGSSLHRRLGEVGVRFEDVPYATFHLDRGLHLFGAIDHIGTSGSAAIAAGPHVLQRQYDGVWPTDHHPVVADVTFGAP